MAGTARRSAFALGVCAALACQPAAAPSGRRSGYRVCGLCFDSVIPLSQEKLTPIDSCAFRIEGDGISISGDVGAFAALPTFDEGQDAVEATDGLRRSRSRAGALWVRTAYAPSRGSAPPFVVTISYRANELDSFASEIQNTVRRCESNLQ